MAARGRPSHTGPPNHRRQQQQQQQRTNSMQRLLLAAATCAALGWWVVGTQPNSTAADGGKSFNFRTEAAREMLPQVQRREAQRQLEARWGLNKLQEPKLQGGPGDQMRIPRILHQVYFPDLQTYLQRTGDPKKGIREEWGRSCAVMHPGWEYAYWDLESATELVEQYYPQYAEMFKKLDSIIKKADAFRYFVMHAIGGLYVDMDIECLRPGEQWLQGADVVLQDDVGTGPTNGELASVPGHPFWEAVLAKMHEQWKEKPWMAVTALTGPHLVRKTFLSMGPTKREGEAYPYAGPHTIATNTVLVHPRGQWLVPCGAHGDEECHRQFKLQLAAGVANLSQVAGYHRYANSWMVRENPEGALSLDGLQKSLCAELEKGTAP